MTLPAWMEKEGLDDEALSARIRSKYKLRCTESWMRQVRLGHGEPSKKLIAAIGVETKGKVGYADLVRSSAA